MSASVTLLSSIMLALKAIFIISILTTSGLAKMVPIIDDKLEICVEPEDNAGKIDYSNLEIYIESDTKVFLNGSLRYKKEIKSPWTAIVFLERFDRGQWNTEAMYKKIPDFCKEIQNPLMPWYKQTSQLKHKHCPFAAGVRYDPRRP